MDDGFPVSHVAPGAGRALAWFVPDRFAPLFTSDLAGQVRETFREMLDFGASVTAATQETVHRFEGALNHAGDGPVVILALAALQLEQGQIHASIRNAALEILQAGAAETLIAAEPPARKKVRQLLLELAEVLEGLDVDAEQDQDDESEEE